jgi:hypothetical protein
MLKRLSAQVDSLLYFRGMKKLVLLTAIAISLTSCAQMNKSIVRASAFYTIPIPGTMQVDDAGQPFPIQRTKVYTIFLEVNENAFEWTKAWADGRVFNVVPHAAKESSVVAGKKVVNNEQVMVRAAKGNFLQHLELSPDETPGAPPQKINDGELLLEGKWKGKRILYKITTVTELASPEYQ